VVWVRTTVACWRVCLIARTLLTYERFRSAGLHLISSSLRNFNSLMHILFLLDYAVAGLAVKCCCGEPSISVHGHTLRSKITTFMTSSRCNYALLICRGCCRHVCGTSIRHFESATAESITHQPHLQCDSSPIPLRLRAYSFCFSPAVVTMR
jgi:hypothetical protein